MQQQLAGPVRVVAHGLTTAHGVRRHMHADQPELAIVLAAERFGDLDLGIPD